LLRFGAREEATADQAATAETFRPELLSNFSSTELIVAIERNDLGAFVSPIPFAPLTNFQFVMRFICASDKVLVSGEKLGSMRLRCSDEV